jgi:glyoxylase-like metal-dependent hydrolase (beta-lactamase superfamily II)
VKYLRGYQRKGPRAFGRKNMSTKYLFFVYFGLMEEHMESAAIITQIAVGPMMNFAYLLGCPETRDAAIVDPGWDASEMLKIAQNSKLKIRHILLTHGHPDHSNALEQLLQATDARVYLHSEEVAYMREVAQSYGSTSRQLPDGIGWNHNSSWKNSGSMPAHARPHARIAVLSG